MPKPEPPLRLLSPQSVLELTGAAVSTIRRAVDRGDLPVRVVIVSPGGREAQGFLEAEVLEWNARRQKEAGNPEWIARKGKRGPASPPE